MSADTSKETPFSMHKNNAFAMVGAMRTPRVPKPFKTANLGCSVCNPTKGLRSSVVGRIPANCSTTSYGMSSTFFNLSSNSNFPAAVGVAVLSVWLNVAPTLYRSSPKGITKTDAFNKKSIFKPGA